MERAGAKQIFRTAIAGLALIGASACSEQDRSGKADNATAAGAGESAPAAKHAPNPSRAYPPSTAFAQFERIDAGKFHSTEQFTVFNPGTSGAVDSIQYQYIYTDDRLAGVRSHNFDVVLQITKFPSAEGPRALLDNAIARAIPIAEADRVRLPPCRGQKRGGDDFVGPSKIVRTLPNPRGGEITILHSGDFNMNDCTRGSNQTETAIWTEGEFFFMVDALPMRPGDTGYGRAQDLAIDYTRALGQR
jgi:hypothetical protein